MKKKIIEVLKDWGFKIEGVKETKKCIHVAINKDTLLSSYDIHLLENRTCCWFFIEYKNEHIIFTWMKEIKKI